MKGINQGSCCGGQKWKRRWGGVIRLEKSQRLLVQAPHHHRGPGSLERERPLPERQSWVSSLCFLGAPAPLGSYKGGSCVSEHPRGRLGWGWGRGTGLPLTTVTSLSEGMEPCLKTYRFSCCKHLLSTCCVLGMLLGTSLFLCHFNGSPIVAQPCSWVGVGMGDGEDCALRSGLVPRSHLNQLSYCGLRQMGAF